tara:strand:+ start:1043 stop:1204 length:162 start_codon:yes stop_codon:yes gene_type:complete
MKAEYWFQDSTKKHIVSIFKNGWINPVADKEFNSKSEALIWIKNNQPNQRRSE